MDQSRVGPRRRRSRRRPRNRQKLLAGLASTLTPRALSDFASSLPSCESGSTNEELGWIPLTGLEEDEVMSNEKERRGQQR